MPANLLLIVLTAALPFLKYSINLSNTSRLQSENLNVLIEIFSTSPINLLNIVNVSLYDLTV
jgi:hypothetical protein